MSISEKILNVRNESGLSLNDFAEKCGIPAKELEVYESGKFIPDVTVRAAITAAFSLAPDALALSEEEYEKSIEDGGEENVSESKETNVAAVATLKTSPKKMFSKCADTMVILPYIYLFVILFAVQFICTMIWQSENNSGSTMSDKIPSTLNAVCSSAYPFIMYRIVKKQYQKAFAYLGRFEDMKQYLCLFFASIYAFVNMATGVITYLLTCILKAFNIDYTSNESISATLTKGAPSVIGGIAGIVLTCIFARWLFKVIYNIDGGYTEAKEKDNPKKVSQIICILTGAYWVYIVVKCITGGFAALSVVSNILMALVLSLIAVSWVLFASADENKSNKLIVKTAPMVSVFAHVIISLVFSLVLLYK